MDRSRSSGGYPPTAAGRPARTSEPEWEICLAGDLSDKQSSLMESFTDLPRRSRGTVYMDSCGGSVYCGLSLAALIRLRGLRATAVALGECSSAALLPFAACARRFVTPHTTLLFHPMRWNSGIDIQLEEAAEWTRHFEYLEKDLDRLLVDLFDCDEDVIRKWTRPGRFVSGPEIVEAGLAQSLSLFRGDLWQQLQQLS